MRLYKSIDNKDNSKFITMSPKKTSAYSKKEMSVQS